MFCHLRSYEYYIEFKVAVCWFGLDMEMQGCSPDSEIRNLVFLDSSGQSIVTDVIVEWNSG